MNSLSPKELLLRQIQWRKVSDGQWRATVEALECRLTMNDFPDQPLYTLTVAGSSLDLDAPPTGWTIQW
jgi:hypothetical protein